MQKHWKIFRFKKDNFMKLLRNLFDKYCLPVISAE